MYYIATYDVGTTAVKGVLVSSDGEIKTSELVQIKTYFQQDYKEKSQMTGLMHFVRLEKNSLPMWEQIKSKQLL